MRKICQYCSTVYGYVESETKGDSHGICDDCWSFYDGQYYPLAEAHLIILGGVV